MAAAYSFLYASEVFFAAMLSGFLVFLLAPFFALAYTVFLHAWNGQTIGKLVMGIRVVAVDSDSLTIGKSFLRAVGVLVSFLSAGVGFLWALIGTEPVTWHDTIAGTRVVVAG